MSRRRRSSKHDLTRERDVLKKKILEMEEKVEEGRERKLHEIEAAREAAEEEINEFKAMLTEEKKKDQEKERTASKQQSLLDETAKIIEYLKLENVKLREQNSCMRQDFRSLKESNKQLREANDSASSVFDKLNYETKEMNSQNARLIKKLEDYKVELENLKDGIKRGQAYYLSEAETRLSYQKTMAAVVTTIQDKCSDASTTEEVVIMALECEASAKSERAALEILEGKAEKSSNSDSSDSDSD